MEKTIDAIYENGVFRPTQPVTGLAEHSRVRVTVPSASPPPPWADCIGIMPDEDAKEISRIIDEEFEKVDPNDW